MPLRQLINEIRKDDVLAASLEYGLLSSAIAVAVIVVLAVWGGRGQNTLAGAV
jgi:Flp pilus assembly pilin Flp